MFGATFLFIGLLACYGLARIEPLNGKHANTRKRPAAADRFYSSRLVLRHCYNQDDFSETMRDHYREHTVEFVMRGLLA